MRVSAFDVRFPKHESKSADANEHNDCLKKYRWNESPLFHSMAAEHSVLASLDPSSDQV